MIEVEEVITCDICKQEIKNEYYAIGFTCKCGEHPVFRICRDCIESAKEVLYGTP